MAKKGFYDPEPSFTWISSQDAEIELPSPEKNTDLQLILQGTAFLGDGVSERIVKIEANGIPVGTLELGNVDPQFYSLAIKAAANRASTRSNGNPLLRRCRETAQRSGVTPLRGTADTIGGIPPRVHC